MTTHKDIQNLFIVILTYKSPLEQIDHFRPAHLEFLEEFYSKNIFIMSGPQNPRTGGVIMAKSISKKHLDKILQKDPFATNNLATYEIIEFTPTKWATE